MARAGDDVAALLGRSADDLAVAARAGGDAAAGAGRAAAGDVILNAERNSIKQTLTSLPPGGVVDDMSSALKVVSDGTDDALKNAPMTPSASAAATNALKNAPNPIAAADDAMKIKFNLPSGKTLAGLAVAGYCIYALASLYDTDGQTIEITKMTPISATQVQIDYTPPSGKLAFALRVGDTLTFSGCATGCINPGLGTEQVVKLNGDTSCIINKSVTSVGGVPYPPPAPSPSGTASGPASTPVPSPSGTAYWGTALVSSTLTNQFVGSVADITVALFSAAGVALGSAVTGAASGLGQGLGIPPGGGPGGPLCNVPLVGGLLCGGGPDGGGGGICSLPIISSICGLGQTFKTIIMVFCLIISLSISAYIAYTIASG